jgi:tetrahedral aminopeptidase
MFELLKKFTSLHGPCGYEQPISYFIRDYVKELVDDVKIDPIGNVIAVKSGTSPGPKVILTAHMDEVGFIVKKIESNGLIRFEKLGGHDDRILLAQKVKIRTRTDELLGVIGTMSAHYVKFDDPTKVRKHQNLYIDIGAKSREDAIEMGVEVGLPVTWASELELLGNAKTGRVVGKGLDDRSGCAVLLSVLEQLSGKEFSGEIHFLFTVQEEVGLRGAKVASHNIEADVAIAVDTTAVSDTPEETMDQSLALGAGTGIKIIDFSLIAHPTVKESLINLAKENEIKFQYEVFPGIGTDGGAVSLSNKGIPTGVLSIPSRYAHSPVEVVDLEDMVATQQLIYSFITSLTSDSTFSF